MADPTPAATPKPEYTATDGGTYGSGPDTLVLTLSEAAYEGDALASIAIDGQTLTAEPIAVTALESAKQSQVFTFKGDFGSGAHDLAVSFVNDAWGGTSATDRNLFVFDASYNGIESRPSEADLYSAGTARFTLLPAGDPEAAAARIVAAPGAPDEFLSIPPLFGS